ncbi:MAG: LacI family DNA-binding transcriptional regulator [Lawsonibacter sp.]
MGRTAGTNIRIVAKAAGVSPATASRALNGNTSVNAELTQRVLEAANKLGYPIHNELRKKNIVFIMPGVSNTYYSKTLTGVFDVIQPLGYRVQIDALLLWTQKRAPLPSGSLQS